MLLTVLFLVAGRQLFVERRAEHSEPWRRQVLAARVIASHRRAARPRRSRGAHAADGTRERLAHPVERGALDGGSDRTGKIGEQRTKQRSRVVLSRSRHCRWLIPKKRRREKQDPMPNR